MDQYSVALDTTLYRVSATRFPAMSPPPLVLQGSGRFDDPQLNEHGEGYSVLYCTATPVAAAVEVMAPFRIDMQSLVDISSGLVTDISERDEILHHSGSGGGIMPASWYRQRQLAKADVSSEYPLLDLTQAGAIQLIREQLAITIYALGLTDLDLSDITYSDRRLTRAISRWVFTQTTNDSKTRFAGVRYTSRFGADLTCYALFSGRYAIVGDVSVESLISESPVLRSAAEILRLDIRE